MTMASGSALSTAADNSTEFGGSSMDDIFEKIRNKFLNEVEPVPWPLSLVMAVVALFIVTGCFCIFCIIKKCYYKKKKNEKGKKGNDDKNMQGGDVCKMNKA